MFQWLVREKSHLCSFFFFFLTSVCVCFFVVVRLFFKNWQHSLNFMHFYDTIPDSKLNQIEWKI